MREILFRGKRIDNGEWVEGSLFLDEEDAYISRGVDFPIWKLVDPSAVGQFTGLTDKNGKRIFEGDVVVSAGTKYRIAMYEGQWAMLDKFGYWCELYRYASECEVIGNIHDNPELLEGGTDNGN